jgi:hypothetical protein
MEAASRSLQPGLGSKRALQKLQLLFNPSSTIPYWKFCICRTMKDNYGDGVVERLIGKSCSE